MGKRPPMRVREREREREEERGREAAREAAHARVMSAVRAQFRPEFINRVDEFIVFDPLSRRQLAEVVKLQVARLQSRLDAKRITLQIDEAAVAFLADRGYDPV